MRLRRGHIDLSGLFSKRHRIDRTTDGTVRHALASRTDRFRAALALSASKFSGKDDGGTPRLNCGSDHRTGREFSKARVSRLAWGLLATRTLESLAGRGSSFNILPAPKIRVEHEV
jgi:hypothetical protein